MPIQSRIIALLALAGILAIGSLRAQHFSFEYFGLPNGLSNLTVRSVAQDRDGFIWVGTANGAFRFDGHRFTRFGKDKGLADDSIQYLFASKDSALYAGTNSGVAVFNEDHFEVLKAANSDVSLTCRGIGCVDRMADGRVLTTSPAGLAVVEGKSYRIVPGTEKLNLHAVYVAPGGEIWITSTKTAYRVELPKSGPIELFHAGENLGLPVTEWGAPIYDGRHRLWIRSRSALYCLEPGATEFRRADIEFPAVGRLNGLAVDAAGQVWVPTFSGLWYRQETPAGHRWVRRSSANGLRADPASSITWDRFGTPWIGLEAHGLNRWNGYPNWTSWQTQDGLSNDGVMSFARDTSGALWVGTKDGLNRMNADGTFSVWNTRNGLAANEVRALTASPDGAIWAGSNEGGLTRFAPGGSIKRFGRESGLRNNRTVGLLAEKNGDLWVCTRAGLFHADWRLPNPVFTEFQTPFSNKHRTFYRVVRSADGSFWVATGAGLGHLKNGKWRTFDQNDGLKRNGAVFMAEHVPGELWIGYTGVNGVARLEFDGAGFLKKLTNYPSGTGPQNDNISFLDPDREGNIWIGTDIGIDVWAKGRWRHLGPEDGLIWHDMMLGGFFSDSEGRVYVGTTSGFSEVRPHKDFEAVDRVSISSISTGGESIPPYKWPNLSIGGRNLHVEFSNLRLLPNARYRYRLVTPGAALKPAAGWVDTANPAVDLSLESGAHRLELQTAAGLGAFGQDTTSLTFNVRPHWYDTFLFRGTMIGLAAFAGFLLWRRRITKEEARRTALESAVQERTRELREQAARIENQKEEIEALLAQSHNANRLKGEFLANMSHEIRTPMNGVIGMTSLALSTELTSEQRDYIETARSSAQGLLQILNDILDFSKIEAGRLDIEYAPLSLRRLVLDSTRPFVPAIHAKNLTFSVDIDPSLADSFQGDQTRLRQILTNLLSNALKFTESGSIELRVVRGEGDTPPRPVVQFSVTDTGIGIAADKLSIIFEQFRQADGSVTRRFGGTGLGLSICVRLAELMGGRMWAESVEGKGTTIHCAVTLQTGSSEPAAPPVSQAENGRNLRVLLVEDNTVSRRLAQRLLEKGGHQVTLALNGLQGIEEYRRQTFDLILMDVQMPEMDGLTATRIIRGMENGGVRRTRILMLTANAMKGDRERCLESGADGYLTKPLEAGEFIRTVSEIAERENSEV